ncbi:MAG: alanine--tRNA ligase [Flavobacteriales bacterium]
MKSSQIRQEFINFFKNKNHEAVDSAPMVIKNDPTLMFTNAGMNQFKDLFLGHSEVINKRVCDTQKCLRVSGKHNDLDEVGYDTYHHTMFEMLGNWSFGDYFKKESINWAWELLTEVYKIQKDRMYVTVFEGCELDKISRDNEAADVWAELIDSERIINGNKKDNFWEMGEVGPCGPCSEIHIDIRPDSERKKIDGKQLVNKDHPQVIEVWNLVFMQYLRKSDGSLQELPQKHVDTGMGFERLCMVLQGVTSNYDTDIFQPLIDKIVSSCPFSYGSDEKIDIAMRVIADHLRAIAFSIADGQLPSNTGAGYVIRRILRRAVRYGFTYLGFKNPFIYSLVNQLVLEMGNQFPELKKQQSLIEKVIKEEEQSFLKTLEKGIEKLDQLTLESSNYIPGGLAFELYDTYGFPIDLTQLIANEKGWNIDLEAFEKLLLEQKDRSRKATLIQTQDWIELKKGIKEEFVGYDQTKIKSIITKYRKVNRKGDEFYQLIFDKTPFYPEGGGQVGDNGFLTFSDEKIEVFDTKKENNQILHFTKSLPSDLSSNFEAVVNLETRNLSSSNHSATHLLHHVLRQVLGSHVEQKGSLVNSDYLRFDFSHFSKVSENEIQTIEHKVNSMIRANYSLNEFRDYPINKAKEMGAIALFGEKYGKTVRVIKFDESVELCGGTHVDSTGKISIFKILSEGAVASGVRRIEAITGLKALNFYEQQLHLNNELKSILKTNDVLKSVKKLIENNQNLVQQLEKFELAKASDVKMDLIQSKKEINGVNLIAAQVSLDSKSIKNLSFELINQDSNLMLVLASNQNDKVVLSVSISKPLVEQRGLHAGNIIKKISKEIDGGGGGQAFFATAGGKNPDGIKNAIQKAIEFLD